MKKTCGVLLAVVIFIMSACQQAPAEEVVEVPEKSIKEVDVLTAVDQIEAAILLEAMSPFSEGELLWDLKDSDGDGFRELYMTVDRTLLMADMTETTLWGYTPTGAAEAVVWESSDDDSRIYAHLGYYTTGSQSDTWRLWDNGSWQTLEQTPNFDGEATLSCPDLMPVVVEGQVEVVYENLDDYMDRRPGFCQTIQGDLDSDGAEERGWLIVQAAQPLLDALVMENSWGDEWVLDCYELTDLTLILADPTQDGVKLSRFTFDGSGEECAVEDGNLVLDGRTYTYSNGAFTCEGMIRPLVEYIGVTADVVVADFDGTYSDLFQGEWYPMETSLCFYPETQDGFETVTPSHVIRGVSLCSELGNPEYTVMGSLTTQMTYEEVKSIVSADVSLEEPFYDPYGECMASLYNLYFTYQGYSVMYGWPDDPSSTLSDRVSIFVTE